jgi:predicted RNA binding protein YcfA (HicA-like mRNA interferase family)
VVLSSKDAAWILSQVGIVPDRRSGEDIFEGFFRGMRRTVVVPRNKKELTPGVIGSIWRQSGLTAKEARDIWENRKRKQKPGES